MNKKKKSSIISETLRKEILSGKFDGTRKLPSEHQLMRRFSVARETVRSALKDLLDKNLVMPRPGYGTFLADSAHEKVTGRLGVIVPDAYYPFYMRICKGLENGAKKHGWSLLSASLGTGDMRERAVRALEFAEVCKREHVSGVFFQPLQFLEESERLNRTILSVLSEANIPVVLLDSDFVFPPQRSEYDLVGLDNVQAGYLLARHVIGAGARKIIYFSNPLPAPTSLQRGNGVAIAVNEVGLHWTKDCVFFADPTDTRAAKRLFDSPRRPDAILAVNDHVASILLGTLAKIKIRVPDDVLLTGVNGDPFAETLDPPLTTAIQPCEQIGEDALELMARRLEDRMAVVREVMIAPALICRHSTERKVKRKRE